MNLAGILDDPQARGAYLNIEVLAKATQGTDVGSALLKTGTGRDKITLMRYLDGITEPNPAPKSTPEGAKALNKRARAFSDNELSDADTRILLKTATNAVKQASDALNSPDAPQGTGQQTINAGATALDAALTSIENNPRGTSDATFGALVDMLSYAPSIALIESNDVVNPLGDWDGQRIKDATANYMNRAFKTFSHELQVFLDEPSGVALPEYRSVTPKVSDLKEKTIMIKQGFAPAYQLKYGDLIQGYIDDEGTVKFEALPGATDVLDSEEALNEAIYRANTTVAPEIEKLIRAWTHLEYKNTDYAQGSKDLFKFITPEDIGLETK
jgi:hypothetical protein